MVETLASSMDEGKITVIDACEEPRNRWMARRLFDRFGTRVLTRTERLERSVLTNLIHFVEESDAVFHFAAHTGIPHSVGNPDDDWASNVDATRNLLEAMRRADRRVPLVMTSSVKPYRIPSAPAVERETRFSWDVRTSAGVDETCQLDPDEPYAASKMAQSALGTAYARSYDMPVCVLRCSNLYGDAPCHGPRHGWLTWFCIAAVLGAVIEVQGTGKQTRDMLFSDDVARAALSALGSEQAMSGSAFNLGGGITNAISCLDAVQVISEYLGREVQTVEGPGRENEDMIFVTDHGRFTRATGWVPETDVRQGMARILDWAERNMEDLAGIYESEVACGPVR